MKRCERYEFVGNISNRNSSYRILQLILLFYVSFRSSKLPFRIRKFIKTKIQVHQYPAHCWLSDLPRSISRLAAIGIGNEIWWMYKWIPTGANTLHPWTGRNVCRSRNRFHTLRSMFTVDDTDTVNTPWCAEKQTRSHRSMKWLKHIHGSWKTRWFKFECDTGNASESRGTCKSDWSFRTGRKQREILVTRIIRNSSRSCKKEFFNPLFNGGDISRYKSTSFLFAIQIRRISIRYVSHSCIVCQVNLWKYQTRSSLFLHVRIVS